MPEQGFKLEIHETTPYERLIGADLKHGGHYYFLVLEKSLSRRYDYEYQRAEQEETGMIP